MCTATWIRDKNGYELFFNRDESLSRAAARPPKKRVCNHVRYIAPANPVSGGTWVGANEFGITLCILDCCGSNPGGSSGQGAARASVLTLLGLKRQAPAPIGGAVASGADERDYAPEADRERLLSSLFDARSLNEVVTRLAARRLTDYQPFTILGFEVGSAVVQCRWQGPGDSLEVDTEVAAPVTSSLYEPADVQKARTEAYRARLESWTAEHGGGPSAGFLLSYHKSHVPEKGPYSVCMHREDAATRSFCHVRASGDAVELFYTPGNPCESDPLPPLRLSVGSGTTDAPSDASIT